MTKHLITVIGRGGKDPHNQAYRTTKYRFPDGQEISRSVFFEAIAIHRASKPDEAVIIGTGSSNWAALLDPHFGRVNPEEEQALLDIYSDIEDQTRDESSSISHGISAENQKFLSEFLTNAHGFPVHISVVPADIDANNGFEILHAYHDSLSHIPPGIENEIIWDITHGLRTMPFLIDAVLRFRTSVGKWNPVRIIYGEMKGVGQIAPVRDLAILREYSDLSWALQVFLEKYDSTFLDVWVRGRFQGELTKSISSMLLAISEFSQMIQTGVYYKIGDRLRQIRNALDGMVVTPSSDAWLSEIFSAMKELTDSFKDGLHWQILHLAERMGEARMFTTAILACQSAVEVYALDLFPQEGAGFEYRRLQAAHDELLRACDDRQWHDVRKSLKSLEYIRNCVAHGGAAESDGTTSLSQQTVERRFRDGIIAAKYLFSIPRN